MTEAYRWIQPAHIEGAWILCHLDAEGQIHQALLHLTHGSAAGQLLIGEAFWRHEP